MEGKLCMKKISNYAQNYALIVIKSRHFSFISCSFSRRYKGLGLKKSSLTFVNFLIDFSKHNKHIGTLKHVTTNLAIVNTHYAPKLCTKTQITSPFRILRLCERENLL